MAKKTFTMNNQQKQKYAELFTKALERMEGARWQKPWVSAHHGQPMNLKHKKAYRGCNDLFLNMLCAIRGWRTPLFLTYNQLTEMGLQLNIQTDAEGVAVLKDNGMPQMEQSFPVVKKLTSIYRNGEKVTFDQYDQMTDEEKDECRWYSALRIYPEFNIEQTNFAQVYPEKWEALTAVPEHDYQEGVKDDVLERMISGGEWRCPIRFGGAKAFYMPSEDRIQLPLREAFRGDEVFYSTALHEMAHSTAPDVKREQGGAFGTEGYAMEEFVAELTAASVCSMLGIGKLLDEQHVSYVASWRKALRDDKDFIPRVIDHVQEATNYILRRYREVSEAHQEVTPLAMAA